MSSERLNRYIAADKKYKEAEIEKKAERVYVEKLLKRCSSLGVSIPGVSYYESERFTFDDNKLFEYISGVVSKEDLEFTTRKTIDMEKLEVLILDGKVIGTDIPKDCYTCKKSPTIKVSHKELK